MLSVKDILLGLIKPPSHKKKRVNYFVYGRMFVIKALVVLVFFLCEMDVLTAFFFTCVFVCQTMHLVCNCPNFTKFN